MLNRLYDKIRARKAKTINHSHLLATRARLRILSILRRRQCTYLVFVDLPPTAHSPLPYRCYESTLTLSNKNIFRWIRFTAAGTYQFVYRAHIGKCGTCVYVYLCVWMCDVYSANQRRKPNLTHTFRTHGTPRTFLDFPPPQPCTCHPLTMGRRSRLSHERWVRLICIYFSNATSQANRIPKVTHNSRALSVELCVYMLMLGVFVVCIYILFFHRPTLPGPGTQLAQKLYFESEFHKRASLL